MTDQYNWNLLEEDNGNIYSDGLVILYTIDILPSSYIIYQIKMYIIKKQYRKKF